VAEPTAFAWTSKFETTMKVLFPTDGSRYARGAARALTTWFGGRGLDVDLLAVVPNLRRSMHRSYGGKRKLTQEWKGVAGFWLEETAQLLTSRGVGVRKIVRQGDPAHVVVARAGAERYDLVVLGAKGRGDAPFFRAGSVALGALEHAPTSVLMVREPSTGHRRKPSSIHPLRLLVAWNGKPESERALRRVLDLLQVEHVEGRALAVADARVGGTLSERFARTTARGAAAVLTAHGLSAAPLVAAGDPAERILDAAGDADLVVLGSRSPERLQELPSRSVSLEVARAAPCSVLVLREGVSARTAGAPTKTERARKEGPAGTPFEIAYRNVAPSPALEEHVLRGLARLEKIASDLVRLHVTVDQRNTRRRKGNLYHVRLDLTLPGREVAVARTPPAHREDEALITAVGEAFDKAREQLIEARQHRRSEVKAHEPVHHGRVADLFPDHGFIRTSHERIVYFHKNSVRGARFDALTEGTEVRFAEEMGEQGPQASTVTVIGKHHPTP
jgi:ribosomal subunit interface protein